MTLSQRHTSPVQGKQGFWTWTSKKQKQKPSIISDTVWHTVRKWIAFVKPPECLSCFCSKLRKQAVAGRRRHVPYRDHKLTNLLRDAVGGTAKVLMHLGVIAVLDASCFTCFYHKWRYDAPSLHVNRTRAPTNHVEKWSITPAPLNNWGLGNKFLQFIMKIIFICDWLCIGDCGLDQNVLGIMYWGLWIGFCIRL